MQQDFEMFAGDTKKINLTVRYDNGTVVDLSGGVIRWVLKRNVNSTQPVTLKTSLSDAPGIVMTDPVNGKCQITLAAADTKNLTPGEYYHEAEVTDFQDNVSTVFTGTVTIQASGV